LFYQTTLSKPLPNRDLAALCIGTPRPVFSKGGQHRPQRKKGRNMNEELKRELRDTASYLIADTQALANNIRKEDTAQALKMALGCVEQLESLIALLRGEN
jgi:hypothetical protein